jgi:hypothetical protein
VISAMEIIPSFQKKYKLQIVNTVFLTDGDGHAMRECYTTDEMGNQVARSFQRYQYAVGPRRIVITDPVTKKQEMIEGGWYAADQTSALIKLLKYRTGCNVLGFYVLSGRDFGKACWKFYPSGVDMNSIKSSFRKEKYSIVKNAGFDEYYLLRSESLDTEEDVEFEVKENATTRGLVSAFSKYAGNKVSSRVVLNRFIGMIS